MTTTKETTENSISEISDLYLGCGYETAAKIESMTISWKQYSDEELVVEIYNNDGAIRLTVATT